MDALTESTQAPIMRRIEADRAGEQSPVPDRRQSTVADFKECSVRDLDHPLESIVFYDVHVSKPPVLRRSLHSRIV